MALQRLIITFKPEETIMHALYKSKDGPGPNTKARRREVTDLTREGLRQTLASLEGDVDVVGTSGYQLREDVLSATASPSALETTEQVKTKVKGA